MPKLAKTVATRVNKAEAKDFTAFEAGPCVLRLRAVSAERDGKPLIGQDSGEPYWSWEFEVVSPEKALTAVKPGDEPVMINIKGRRLWMITSLGESSDWKMKETFAAFGVPPTTDTDEIIGEMVRGAVGCEIQSKGQRKGEFQNTIGKLSAYTEAAGDDEEGWDDDAEEGEDPEGADVEADADEEDPF